MPSQPGPGPGLCGHPRGLGFGLHVEGSWGAGFGVWFYRVAVSEPLKVFVNRYLYKNHKINLKASQSATWLRGGCLGL